MTPLARDLSRVRHGIVVGATCDAITSMRETVDVARALAAPLVTIPGGHLAPAGLSSTRDRLIAHTRAAVDG